MRRIELSIQDEAKLRALGFVHPDLAIAVDKWLPPNMGVYLLPQDVCEDLRASLTEILARIGLDKDYELTDSGKDIEDLIDRFLGA